MQGRQDRARAGNAEPALSHTHTHTQAHTRQIHEPPAALGPRPSALLRPRQVRMGEGGGGHNEPRCHKSKPKPERQPAPSPSHCCTVSLPAPLYVAACRRVSRGAGGGKEVKQVRCRALSCVVHDGFLCRALSHTMHCALRTTHLAQRRWTD